MHVGLTRWCRCAVREHADQASKDIFTPAFFPSLPEVSPSEIEDIPDLVRPEEKAQVSFTFFIPLNQTLTIPFRIMRDSCELYRGLLSANH